MNKTITCCFCEKTVELIDDCQVLFGKDVCPECARNLTRLANKMMVEKDIKKEGQDVNVARRKEQIKSEGVHA